MSRYPSLTLLKKIFALISISAILFSLVACGSSPVPITASSISLSTTSIQFPNTYIGASSPSQVLTISNEGIAPVAVMSVGVQGPYSVDASLCIGALQSGSKCSASIKFQPFQSGPTKGALSITTDNAPSSVSLAGTGLAPDVAALSISSNSIVFPETTVGKTSDAQQLVIKNAGIGSVQLSDAQLQGPFTLSSSTCAGVLASNATCIVSLAFAPTQAGNSSGILTLKTAATAATVTLAGIGSISKPILLLQTTPNFSRPGASVQLTAYVDGVVTPSQMFQWKTASGSISPDGVLTVPQSAVEGTNVTITATSLADPNESAAISLPVWPELPELIAISPESIPVGATTSVSLTGQSLEHVSQIMANGQSVPFTLKNSTQLVTQLTTSSLDSGSVALTAVVAGSQGGSSNSISLPISTPTVTADAAVRFLQQAAYGGTMVGITQVQNLGMAGWIDQQERNPIFDYTTGVGLYYGQYYRNTLNSQYWLRQRVSFALSQIFVTGEDSVCEGPLCGPHWEALLERDAFGNAKTLLRDVALSPIMGYYLNNLNNNGGAGNPNQNFARELMQVMTIGPVLLNQDGSAVLNSEGNPITAYEENHVLAMADALSGWIRPVNSAKLLDYADIPMVMNDSWHARGAKMILPNVTLAAGQSGAADFDAAIDALYQHQNFGPFLCRRLIQHLVMSNPSPAYIARVSTVFADDGTGTRGNLGAVVKAILLDPEARLGDDPDQVLPSGGHYMEPILFLANIANLSQAIFGDDQVRDIDGLIGQQLYDPPSVFSFYSPDHQLSDGFYAPEVQLVDAAHAVAKLGVTYNLTHNATHGVSLLWSSSPFWNSTSKTDLLNRINHLLYHGRMPPAVLQALSGFIDANANKTLNSLLPDLFFLAFSNTAYQVIQ